MAARHNRPSNPSSSQEGGEAGRSLWLWRRVMARAANGRRLEVMVCKRRRRVAGVVDCNDDVRSEVCVCGGREEAEEADPLGTFPTSSSRGEADFPDSL